MDDKKVRSDTRFRARARCHQSKWREEKGYEFVKHCNWLNADFAKENGVNFLNKDIFEIVKQEVAKPEKVIQEPRIWNNLLSSQPMAFNLFGELSRDLDLTTRIFQNLATRNLQHRFPERNIEKISEVCFEHSPGRSKPSYTNDRTAFDVFVKYENARGEKCFFGIEVKYAEDLRDKPSTHKLRYEEIANDSEIFDMTRIDLLKKNPYQQIWRDHLLALSLFKSNHDYDTGDFIFLYPKENNECQKAVEEYKSLLSNKSETHFVLLLLEDFVETINQLCRDEDKWVQDWVEAFKERYLNIREECK